MGINWNVITEKHVAEACKAVAQRTAAGKAPRRGLVVSFDGQMLPAKDVARSAYLIAIGKPLDTHVDFTSGETLITKLRVRGCDAMRLTPTTSETGSPRGTPNP
jgi:hypothetical protein